VKGTYSLLIFLLCASLISITCLTPLSIAGAQSNINTLSIGLSSYGTISYSQTPIPTPSPTPTPTPKANNTNIAVIPSYWDTPGAWGIYTGYAYYPVTWQGQTTIELVRDPNYVSMCQSNGWYAGIYEMDGNKVSVNPGDHIVYSAWIWTGTSTIGQSNGWGCAMGIDVYAPNGRLCELDGANGAENYDGSVSRLMVNWGSGAWVQLKMDFTIQSQYKADSTAGYTRGTLVTPTAIIPWFLGQGYYTGSVMTSEAANSYIYGTILYINPTLS
jgi:hypothetical protein